MKQKYALLVLLVFPPGCVTTELGIRDGTPDEQALLKYAKKVQRPRSSDHCADALHSIAMLSAKAHPEVLTGKGPPFHASWIHDGVAELGFQALDPRFAYMDIFTAPYQKGNKQKLGAYGQAKLGKNAKAGEAGFGYLCQSPHKNWQALFRAGYHHEQTANQKFQAMSLGGGYWHYRDEDRWFPLTEIQAGGKFGAHRVTIQKKDSSVDSKSQPLGRRESQGHNPGGNYDNREGDRGNPHQHDDHIDHGDTESDGHDHRRIPSKTVSEQSTYYRVVRKKKRLDLFASLRLRVVNLKLRYLRITPTISGEYSYSTLTRKSSWRTGIGVELGRGFCRITYSRDWTAKQNRLTFSFQIHLPTR